MSGVENIGVRIIQGDRRAEPSDAVWAILHEIAAQLTALVTQGEASAIDLRRLPLAPGDYEKLKNWLGTGEVTAMVDALGPTHLQETRFAGVWWVTHCNLEEEIVGELIEVTACPEILQANLDDIRLGLEGLQLQLQKRKVTKR